MKRKLVIAIIVIFSFSSVFAVLYITKKQFTKNNLPAGAKLSKVTVKVKEEDKKELREAWNLRLVPDKQRFYLGKKEDGSIAAATTFQVIHSHINNEYHHVAVALHSDGSVKAVGFIDLQTDWPQRIAKKSFFSQFKDKPAKPLKIGDDIDSITEATESVETVILAVNTAMALYKKYILKK